MVNFELIIQFFELSFMKKLLIPLCLLVSINSIGSILDAPKLIEGELIQNISPNGEWIASQVADGSVAITNLISGKFWVSESDHGDRNYYIGLGNAVSNNGTVVGSTTTSNAAYWENGEWNVLNTPNAGYISNATSITPDGNIICGGVGVAPFSADTETPMLYPALWYRQPDNTFGEPFILPHPELDLTSRAPQYITAISISEDGKTVGGQIMDYTGACVEPIVYQCNDKGNWSFTRLGEGLINPNNIEFPEWPGALDDNILLPSQEWFMTEEQIESFVDAFNDWDNTGQPPRYEDFMTSGQIEEYQKALKEYYNILNEWSVKFEYFMDVYRQYLREGSSFYFNNGFISTDGKYYVSTANCSLEGVVGVYPIIFNLADYSYKILETNYPVVVSYLSADYTILSYIPGGSDIGTYKAVIFPQMYPGGILLEDYVQEKNTSLYNWMIETLTHDVITGPGINTVYSTEEMVCTGIPTATPNLEIIATGNSTYSWNDYFGGEEFVSILLPMKYMEDTGVDVISSDNEIPFIINKENEIEVTRFLCSMNIYELSGRKVFSKTNINGKVCTKLPLGIYIIKVIDANSKIYSLKVKI